MKLFLLLSVFVVATLGSDIARVYANGQELARGGQDLAVAYPSGKEKANNGNSNLAVIEVSGKEKSKLAYA